MFAGYGIACGHEKAAAPDRCSSLKRHTRSGYGAFVLPDILYDLFIIHIGTEVFHDTVFDKI